MRREAQPQALRLTRIAQLPVDFGDLVELSLREDFRALQRMREEWAAGANRFDRPGEALFEVRAGSRLVGICGLNRDPYAQASGVGRVRHLFVDPEFRRQGVGRSLVARVIECSRASFSLLRLRTLTADADRFYVALGFRRVTDPDATHEL